MKNLDANSLVVFHLVAQAGSLTKAAIALGLSRSALSHRIKTMEARLDCQLLLRTTRNVGLTEAGFRLAQYAGRIANTLTEANLLANGLNEDTSGPIRISAPPGLGGVWLKPRVMSYMHANPRVIVDLRLSAQTVDLAKDPFDLAIRVTSNPPEQVVARKLFAISWWLCASPQWVSRFSEALADEDLAHIPIGGFSRGDQFRSPEITLGRKSLTTMRSPVLVSNDLDVIKDAVLQSLCMAVLPDYCVKPEITAGRLMRLLPNWIIDARQGEQAYALHLPGRMTPRRVKRLVEFLRVRS